MAHRRFCLNPAIVGIVLIVSHPDFPEAVRLQSALRALGIQLAAKLMMRRDLSRIRLDCDCRRANRPFRTKESFKANCQARRSSAIPARSALKSSLPTMPRRLRPPTPLPRRPVRNAGLAQEEDLPNRDKYLSGKRILPKNLTARRSWPPGRQRVSGVQRRAAQGRVPALCREDARTDVTIA